MDIQNGNKAHLDTDFREWVKSPLSNPNGNQCVELSFTSDAVGMRDSQNPDGAVLVFDNDEWNAFVGAVESGFFQHR
ncbi:DUF397 domain-containing protein [Amycolatopsis minnesotensis]|uniref:DUF397 domain-containing protein n=1 Tax=Amycolatopsis minnesotensis TaxID=337894 RepID=A0ABN2SUE0_9PSEU